MPYTPQELKKIRERAKQKKKPKPKLKARPETKKQRIVRQRQQKEKYPQGLGKAVDVGYAPKITPLITNEKLVDESKTEPKLDGSEYAPYSGAAGRAGFEYGRDIEEVLADETVSPEIKESLEEEILYEGDYKGGRVGKGKKMKMKKGGSPRGCGAARRGYGKAMMGGGMVKGKRNYSGGGRIY